ncbi:S-formylglutathione hydrolase FrmB [Marinilactibacillus piezotolerans]|uniref:S-formylglutathione hydrolase FrmB n=1 Tax=Marinilactibacillus piezotolerans TaxID=258723 RepID=A0A1I3XA59_9LACT|nr:alpha/beta hydrolase-fold protein [Marinilactibacillus piezotolerans]SFK16513.1 S-formylglutathione hydrolase FrmB [Marinilactibacillus piezotolerans]
MATFTGTMQSKELMRKVSFTAIIPSSTKSIYDPRTEKSINKSPFKTLYLLHGWDGNHEDWVQNTRIVELATKLGVAVIMPSGENSFYVDHSNGDYYGRFIGQELVNETRHLFNLSTKREDTWIASLSMGGYGALRNGLSYSETFSKIAAFSSRILTKNDPNHDLSIDDRMNAHLQYIIGSKSYKDLSLDMDIYELVLQSSIPELFIACGTEDFIYEDSLQFHKFLKDNQINHIYRASPGEHKWNFWDRTIEEAIEWMVQ